MLNKSGRPSTKKPKTPGGYNSKKTIASKSNGNLLELGSPTNAEIEGVGKERTSSFGYEAPELLIDKVESSDDDEEENYDEVMTFSHSQPSGS